MNESARQNWLLTKLSRTTLSGDFVPQIDGLRFLAIMSVIAFHVGHYVAERSPRPYGDTLHNDPLYVLSATGHVGVQMFFVISGMVVSLPFAKHRLAGGKKVSLKYYFLRRLTRIEPPYVIALVFWMLAFGVSGKGIAPWQVMLHHFPASLFYVHNAVYGTFSYVLPPAWSLEIEVQFYVIAPLLALVFIIRGASIRRAAILAMVCALALGQKWLRPAGMINGLNLLQEGHYFLIGLLLADLFVSRLLTNESTGRMKWDALTTAAFILLPVIIIKQWEAQLVSPMLLLLAYIGVFRGRAWRALLGNPWIYTIGGMCYTIYLYHGFFKASIGHFTVGCQIGDQFWLNFLIQMAILVPGILAGSAVLFVLTEKPFMKRDWFRRFVKKSSVSQNNISAGATIDARGDNSF